MLRLWATIKSEKKVKVVDFVIWQKGKLVELSICGCGVAINLRRILLYVVGCCCFFFFFVVY